MGRGGLAQSWTAEPCRREEVPTMNRREIDAVERDDVTEKELMDALRQALPAPTDERPRSENRKPTREEREVRYRLERRRR